MPHRGIDREDHGLKAISIKGVENYTFDDVHLEEDADRGIGQGFQAQELGVLRGLVLMLNRWTPGYSLLPVDKC